MNCEFCEKEFSINELRDKKTKLEFRYSDIEEECHNLPMSVTEYSNNDPADMYICQECIHRIGLDNDNSVPCPFCLLPIIDPHNNICNKCMVKNYDSI